MSDAPPDHNFTPSPATPGKGGNSIPSPGEPRERSQSTPPSATPAEDSPSIPSPATPGEGKGEGATIRSRRTVAQPTPAPPAASTQLQSHAAAPLFYDVSRIVCRIYTTLYHDLKVHGAHNVPLRGGVIIAANHQSNLDPVLIGVRLPRPLSFLAKSELFENPHFRWLIRNLNAFPVRQGEGDVGAVRETIRRLQEGHALTIYPEGARSRSGEIAPIEKGIGLIVKRAGVPVVPAIIDGSVDAMPPGSKTIRPAPIRVEFGPPLHLANLKSAQIVDKIGLTLRTMLTNLRQRDPVLQQAWKRRHGQ